jgi:hypothetical protein
MCYIAPPTSLWNLRRELTFFNENLTIGVHGQSNPQEAEWLGQIVQYSLLRYKEAYLEGRGIELTTFSVSPLERNMQFEAEMVFSKYYNLTGKVECNFIKFMAPRFNSARGTIRIMDGPKTPQELFDNQVKYQGWRMQDDPLSNQEAEKIANPSSDPTTTGDEQ